MDKKQEVKIEKEVKKRLHHRIYSRGRESAVRFKLAFKEKVAIAVSAALGFLIALSWREPIADVVGVVVSQFSSSDAIFFKFFSAIIVTVLGVIVLMFVSRWAVKKK